jgi:hypothetical protein
MAKGLEFEGEAQQKAIDKLNLGALEVDIRCQSACRPPFSHHTAAPFHSPITAAPSSARSCRQRRMRQILDALAPPLVMSHNDLLNGNIMRLADGTVQFIDFEYGGTNYRGFDLGGVELYTAPLRVCGAAWALLIAAISPSGAEASSMLLFPDVHRLFACEGNHFNEFAGFDCDYSRYPGPDMQRFFIREYLAEAATGPNNSDAEVRYFTKQRWATRSTITRRSCPLNSLAALLIRRPTQRSRLFSKRQMFVPWCLTCSGACGRYSRYFGGQ